ncbi:MAG: CHASE2 domain-containing protein [Thermodesulfobacteriota bacterium]
MKRGGRFRRPRALILLCGAVITLLFCLSVIYRPTLLTLISHKVYDAMVRALPVRAADNGPLIVDLDEKTLAEWGQWPWPRHRVALLLEKISRMGPRAVALDILFAEPDRTSVHVLRRQFARDFGVGLEFSGPTRPPANNDLVLAGVLGQGPFVLGYKFFFDENGQTGRAELLHPVDAMFAGGDGFGLHRFFTARTVITNLPEISAAAPAAGFLNYPADEDGVLRRVPLLIRFQDHLYPSLALATVMQAVGKKRLILDMEDDRLQALLLENRRIPVDEAGQLLLAFRSRERGFEYVSAGDILADRLPAERIADRTVLVGTTATGLGDMHPTPLFPLYPGVEVHATIVDNIMTGRFLSRPLWTDGVELAAVFFFGLLSTLILVAARPLASLLLLVPGSVLLWYGAFLLLARRGFFVNPLWPVLLLVVNCAVLSLLRFWREERRVRQRTRELLLAQDTTILSLTALAETRDNETGGHILRTQHYVRALAEQLVTMPRYRKDLDWAAIDLLFRSAPLHDIGKVGVADHILLNPGKLTPEEFEEMKKHTVYGHETLLKAEALLRDERGHSFLRVAGEIAWCHHEKWDGSGYPRGLRSEEIPLAGRLMALADVYDALITERRYKPAFSHQEAVRIIRQGSGSHFDPDVVKAFLAQEESFQLIARHFSDEKEFGRVPAASLPGDDRTGFRFVKSA